MTRLPQLERQLLEAARALERPRRRWWRIGLLGAGVTLVATATAVGAMRLLLPEGDAVPAPAAGRVSLPRMDPGTTQVLSLRVPDPEGGLPWGMAITRTRDGRLVCTQVGRVQGDRIGIVGRDGAFGDDGRFHPLEPGSNQGGDCSGAPPDGDLRSGGDQPPIPASGYTGDVLGSVGGCREDVPLASMSPGMRRRYRDVPVCKPESLRVVKYGFAGRDATRIEYAGRTIRPDPGLSGAYLFVLPATGRPLTLKITHKDGSVCESTYPTRALRPPRLCL